MTNVTLFSHAGFIWQTGFFISSMNLSFLANSDLCSLAIYHGCLCFTWPTIWTVCMRWRICAYEKAILDCNHHNSVQYDLWTKILQEKSRCYLHHVIVWQIIRRQYCFFSSTRMVSDRLYFIMPSYMEGLNYLGVIDFILAGRILLHYPLIDDGITHPLAEDGFRIVGSLLDSRFRRHLGPHAISCHPSLLSWFLCWCRHEGFEWLDCQAEFGAHLKWFWQSTCIQIWQS